MRYTLYLLGCVVLAALGAVVSISSSGTALEFYRLTGLLDYATLAWLLEQAEAMNASPPRTPEECRAYYETISHGGD